MISQETIKQARQTDLVAYLTAKGEELKRIGKWNEKTIGQLKRRD